MTVTNSCDGVMPNSLSVSTQPISTVCGHCGLHVPTSRRDETRSVHFCCAGCETAFHTIHEIGLDDFYALNLERTMQPARATGRKYEEFDSDVFLSRYAQVSSDRVAEIELYLEGIHCAACVWLLERVPRIHKGVNYIDVNLSRSSARVSWDLKQGSLSTIARTIDALGYPVHPYRGLDRFQARQKEERELLVRIGIAGACAGNVMMIAFALYAGMFGDLSVEHATLFRWASLVITAPAVFISGGVFFRGAWAGLRARTLHMDLPLSLGIAAGFVWGGYNTIRGVGEIYFDSVTTLIFFLLVGRWLQMRQQRRAIDSAEMLNALTPLSARIVEGGQLREVPIEAVFPGTIVEVPSGEVIPVDGKVLNERVQIDTALLTGEAKPQLVNQGETVHAGTRVLDTPLRLEAISSGEETRVGRLLRQIEALAHRKSKIVLWADSLVTRFVVLVFLSTMATLGYWLWRSPVHALDHAVALLIVTCPCALALATPLAVSVAIGRAAKRGILIKGGDVLETLATPGILVLDKTGTLTEGRFHVVYWDGDGEIKPHIAALESSSRHVIAQAIVTAFSDRQPHRVEAVRETIGSGIEGIVDERHFMVGSVEFLKEKGIVFDHEHDRAVMRCIESLFTPVVVAVNGRIAATIGLGDPLRDDAQSAIAALRAQGWRIHLLSGDRPEIVAAYGNTLGIPSENVEGGASPERKLDVVKTLARDRTVVMVGDGINDAGALAVATCGIAVHGGAEASLSVADIFLTKPGLSGIVETIVGASSALKTIKQNCRFSLVYNVTGAVLAVTGIINPLIAAILMPISSLTVVSNSLRSKNFGKGT